MATAGGAYTSGVARAPEDPKDAVPASYVASLPEVDPKECPSSPVGKARRFVAGLTRSSVIVDGKLPRLMTIVMCALVPGPSSSKFSSPGYSIMHL